jgi:hypothetical protein
MLLDAMLLLYIHDSSEMSETMMMRMIFESYESFVLIITVFGEFKFEFSVKNKGNKFKASFLFKR